MDCAQFNVALRSALARTRAVQHGKAEFLARELRTLLDARPVGLDTWAPVLQHALALLEAPVPHDAAPETGESEPPTTSCGLFVACALLPRDGCAALQGMMSAKAALHETLVYPRLYPRMFGTLQPWRRVLLFGPPGTGKSTLTRAVVSQAFADAAGALYAEISASDVLSAYYGESEQAVRRLFAEALSARAPVVIYLDEIDSLARTKRAAEDDTSRRVKNELLRGLECLSEATHVYCVASTNVPWELDVAVVRRFERRICVGLPDAQTRHQIFAHTLCGLPEAALEAAVARSSGYSGADLATVCRYAQMIPVRELIARAPLLSHHEREAACPRAVTADDVGAALDVIHRSVDADTLAAHEQWAREYGET